VVRRLVIVALAVAIVGATVAAPARAADTSTTHTVAVRTEHFVDRSRPTEAVPVLHFKGGKVRKLPTTIWYPSDDRGPFPLIVFSHGVGGSPQGYETTLRAWAAAGFVVAGPLFPIGSLPNEGNAAVTDVRNQTGDVSFVITKVLALDRQKKSGLGHIIDSKHIGVAGHSLGAVTTLGVAFRSCCRDKRIDAVISYAGTPLIYGTDFKGITTPLLLVHGNADATVDYRGSVASFNRARGPKFFITIINGTHGAGILGDDPVVTAAVAKASLDFWRAYLLGDTSAVARLRQEAVVPGRTALQVGGI
jgi:predicted dienelactone hydrolase